MIQPSSSKNELVRRLYLCGQVAEHKSRMVTEHGDDENRIFDILSEEEKSTLSDILCRLQDKWRKDHAAHRGDK